HDELHGAALDDLDHATAAVDHRPGSAVRRQHHGDTTSTRYAHHLLDDGPRGRHDEHDHAPRRRPHHRDDDRTVLTVLTAQLSRVAPAADLHPRPAGGGGGLHGRRDATRRCPSTAPSIGGSRGGWRI